MDAERSGARSALVTGAARGIGAAIAERLAADGMRVTTLDRDAGCDLQRDVASDDLDGLGDIDACVACAGITDTIAPAHRMTIEQWQRDVDVNLTGTFRTIQACLPGMRERRYGRVVVIGSIAAIGGLPGQVAYAASKAGQLGMMRTLAAENAAYGITVNSVLPGLTATERVLEMPAAIRTRVLESLPTGRTVEPAEVAALVAMLVGDDVTQLTGQAVAIDGGAGLNAMSLGNER